MKTYLVILSEKDPNVAQEDLVAAHVAHLKQLNMHQQLVCCGPYKQADKAMLVLKSASQSEVNDLVNQDPFVKHHYYKRYQIDEIVLANESNHWLLEE